MWTTENRRRYDHSHPCYESELTDEEWSEMACSPLSRGRAG
jgi:hypothetical protein